MPLPLPKNTGIHEKSKQILNSFSILFISHYTQIIPNCMLCLILVSVFGLLILSFCLVLSCFILHSIFVFEPIHWIVPGSYWYIGLYWQLLIHWVVLEVTDTLGCTGSYWYIGLYWQLMIHWVVLAAIDTLGCTGSYWYVLKITIPFLHNNCCQYFITVLQRCLLGDTGWWVMWKAETCSSAEQRTSILGLLCCVCRLMQHCNDKKYTTGRWQLKLQVCVWNWM